RRIFRRLVLSGRRGQALAFFRSRTRFTASPTVRTLSASSSLTWMPKISSSSSTMSTRRAELTFRSFWMAVSRGTFARASLFLANGFRIATTFSNTSFWSIGETPHLVFELAEDDACVHVAESEAGFGDDFQVGQSCTRVRDTLCIRGERGMQILAI